MGTSALMSSKPAVDKVEPGLADVRNPRLGVGEFELLAVDSREPLSLLAGVDQSKRKVGKVEPGFAGVGNHGPGVEEFELLSVDSREPLSLLAGVDQSKRGVGKAAPGLAGVGEFELLLVDSREPKPVIVGDRRFSVGESDIRIGYLRGLVDPSHVLIALVFPWKWLFVAVVAFTAVAAVFRAPKAMGLIVDRIPMTNHVAFPRKCLATQGQVTGDFGALRSAIWTRHQQGPCDRAVAYLAVVVIPTWVVQTEEAYLRRC
ncbi:uncharacterized protein Z518_11287 [Rhinocladiella mackenziei CBS 650.93]|uniref:Uncharacterized protein n=1 Tax=Rhinocladiella mackenziei CBS 650.93 TaxID=1442369 RepID=A0A0D2I1G1_9EURO|nr:uncharacterized protein Z518_11287 [Rhinocladiella mackenziei CBS 650.93]KIW99548.1 hypothetical protein Z518_11287 [Rhinocladiella mackenziei CBS 650.93]